MRTERACCLLMVVALALGGVVGCDDEVNLGEIRPIASLGQDWDGDGTVEALPADTGGTADYLLDFGPVVVKQRSSRVIVLANDAAARDELTWSNIRLDNASADFVVDEPPVNDIPPGQATYLTVHYIPFEDGPDSGTLVVETNDPDRKTITVSLAGEGVTPDVEVCVVGEGGAELCNQAVAPNNLGLDFGLLDLNDSAQRQFVVRNKGVFALTVAAGGGQGGVDFSSSTSGEYGLSPGPFTGELAPNESRSFSIDYTPFDGGADPGRIEITSNDPDEPIVIIELTGSGLAPKICPPPPLVVDFGSVGIGTSSRKSYRFTSCGTQVLTVSALTLDSGMHGFFSFAVAVTTPFDLAPGEAFDIELTYAPTTEGAHAGKVTIESNDPNAGTGWIDLVGKATPIPTCDIDVLPNPVNFGAVPTTGFATVSVALRNMGDADCTVSKIEFPPGSNPEFSLPNPPSFPIFIPPFEMRPFTARYQPTDEGPDSGSLVVTVDNDPDEPTVTVNLAGEGVQPPPCDFRADPSALNFGAVPMGQPRDLMTRVYNFGSDECTIWDWSLVQGSDPSYTVSAPPFPRPSVPSGGYQDITVTLNPQSSGMLTGQVEIKGGDTPFNSPKIYVSLTGGGEAASICLNPTVLDFGPVAVGQTRDLTFDITACASGNLKIRQIAFDGVNPDFTFAAAPGAPRTIPAGQRHTVSVRYSPSDQGADFGRVAISSNDEAKPTVYVDLRGNYSGTCPSVFDCQPSALWFPDTPIGQSSDLAFTCTNHGSEPLTVVSVGRGAGTSTEFHLGAPGLPMNVPAGGELQVEVGYIPVDVGPDSGSVTIQSEFTAAGCDNFTLISVPVEAQGVTPDLPPCISPRVFQPVEIFRWPNGNIAEANFNQVFMTPILINLNDDNGDGFINEEDVPDLVFNSFAGGVGISEPAIVRAISGDDGHTLWSVTDTRFRTNYETQLAAGDIDGDNLPEVLASKLVVTDSGDMTGKFVTGNILCFEHDGTFKWESEPWHAPEDDIEDGSAIGIADLDHDGHPEIFRGSSVFDHHGQLLWEGTAGRGGVGHGVFCTAADLDMQGGLELLCGNTAYRADGTILWQSSVGDGMAGVADFNLDGLPEVLIFSGEMLNSGLKILNGQTGATLASLGSSSGVNAILPPVIADVDGTSGLEAGVVGTCQDQNQEDTECFWLMDINPSNFSITVTWQEILNDSTLGGGNTAFDFEGDGPYEVVQNDEQYVTVHSGLDGSYKYRAERWSVTGWELPIVADVNNDGHAEIVVIENGLGMDHGILVYGNVDNDWVATRRIWNQFDYHVTNVRENGTIPRFEVPNWTVYNNFLANEPFCE